MGNVQGTRLRKRHALLNQSLKKFGDEEIQILAQTFNGLASHSPGKTVDKATFLKVFHLPGMLGERLFAAFDRRKNGVIDYEEFMAGLALMSRGTADEKVDFSFMMYDLDGNGVVTRAELTTMMNSVVYAAYTILEAADDPHSASPEDLLDEAVRLELMQRVEEIVQSAFEKVGQGDNASMTKEQFKDWLRKHPDVLEVLDTLLPLHEHTLTMSQSASTMATGTPKERQSPVTLHDIMRSQHSDVKTRTPARSNSFIARKASVFRPKITSKCSSCAQEVSIGYCYVCGSSLKKLGECETCGEVVLGRALKFCMACGFDLSLNDKPVEPVYSASARGNSRRTMSTALTKKEGWMQKVGHVFKGLTNRYFVLKDNFLYYYHSQSEKKPHGTIFLEGCFIEAVDHSIKNPRMQFGLEIVVPEDAEHTRYFYAKDAQDQESWLSALRNGARQFKLEDYYEIREQLGVGKFSKVHRCLHKSTGKEYAVKIIDKSSLDEAEREALRTEIAVLQLIHHPNIIRLRNLFETRHTMYLLTTLVRGGDLFDRLVKKKRYDETDARIVIDSLLNAMGFLHRHGIVHRDLKPENILLTSTESDTEIQIGDFGLSKFAAPEEIMNLPCGTLAYVAPEVLQMKGYNKSVDLWSIGVITYVLLRGRLPFSSKSREDIIEKTLSGKIPFDNDEVWSAISAEAKDFIRQLLQTDVSKRMTVQQALEHPWLVFGLKKGNSGLGDRMHLHRRSLSAAPSSPSASRSPSPNTTRQAILEEAEVDELDSPKCTLIAEAHDKPPLAPLSKQNNPEDDAIALASNNDGVTPDPQSIQDSKAGSLTKP